ncbi:uncharacterized protein LOC110849361 isoform X1 [Folsomia candida]|nr:uncharacterized protein LOC110849361 isoform X1 [Folsomia candida]XP_035707027.1 uncharacterized protein LOC110849361 isoform X1 [Folsomia candida]XP_035707028.1 uncharacterized protein LOC110849361 isoform X1 [Folsomia candida]
MKINFSMAIKERLEKDEIAKREDQEWKANITVQVSNITAQLSNLTDQLNILKYDMNYFHTNLSTPIVHPDKETASDFEKCSPICGPVSIGRSGSFTDNKPIRDCCYINYQYVDGYCQQHTPLCMSPADRAVHNPIEACDSLCSHRGFEDQLNVCCGRHGFAFGFCDNWNHAVCWKFIQ